jgi:hypothetical protein
VVFVTFWLLFRFRVRVRLTRLGSGLYCIHCGTTKDVEVSTDRVAGQAVRPQCTKCTEAEKGLVPYGHKRTSEAMAAQSEAQGAAFASHHAAASSVDDADGASADGASADGAAENAEVDEAENAEVDEAAILAELQADLEASHGVASSSQRATNVGGSQRSYGSSSTVSLRAFLGREQARQQSRQAATATSGGQRWQQIMAEEPSGAGDMQRIANAAASGDALDRSSRQRRPPRQLD